MKQLVIPGLQVVCNFHERDKSGQKYTGHGSRAFSEFRTRARISPALLDILVSCTVTSL